MNANERIIVALDTDSFDKCEKLVNELKDTVKYFKVGKELFTSCGSDVLRLIDNAGAKCFLDLKYHDIPNTVAKASKAACRLGIAMFNVHASGGLKMMKAASEAVIEEAEAKGIERPLLIGVTVLTSMSEEELQTELSVSRGVEDQVVALANLAKEAGLDGVVASAKEVRMIKDALGDDFVVVTPGIRPTWAAKGDQTRVVTPADAYKMGVDYMVIGRPITASDNPKEAAEKIIAEISSAE